MSLQLVSILVNVTINFHFQANLAWFTFKKLRFSKDVAIASGKKIAIAIVFGFGVWVKILKNNI